MIKIRLFNVLIKKINKIFKGGLFMKKLGLGIFLLTGILLFSEKRIVIKSGSYCTGYLGETGYEDDSQTTEGGILWKYYMFKKCVVNGKNIMEQIHRMVVRGML